MNFAKNHPKFFSVKNRMLLIILILLLIYLIKIIFFKTYVIVGPSMEPTFYTNDKIFAKNLSYFRYTPQRFDIIILKKPDENYYIIKRVIGLPGETVRIKNGKTFINGNLIQESFVKFHSKNCPDCFFKIPKNKIFILGDNRCNSIDSRCFGLVPISNVKAQALFVYWKNFKFLSAYNSFHYQKPLRGFFCDLIMILLV